MLAGYLTNTYLIQLWDDDDDDDDEDVNDDDDDKDVDDDDDVDVDDDDDDDGWLPNQHLTHSDNLLLPHLLFQQNIIPVEFEFSIWGH